MSSCTECHGSLGQHVSADCPILKVSREERDRRVHLAHCYQGENEDNCKYGEADCPAAPSIKDWQEALEYYLGDYVYEHSPRECRAEAYRRSLEPDPMLEAMDVKPEQRIEINKAYIVSRTEWEKSRMSVAHDIAIQEMNLALFEHKCEADGVKPTLARYRKYLRQWDKDIAKAKYEDEVSELIDLYEKEVVNKKAK